MADTARVIDEHAQEFTDIERQTLQVWFDVDDAGNDVLADAVLNAGLQFEHFTSLLANDPAQRTPDMIAHSGVLQQRFSFQLQQAAAFLRTVRGRGTTATPGDRQTLEDIVAKVDDLRRVVSIHADLINEIRRRVGL